MSRELLQLCVRSLYNPRSRRELVDVGRSVRNAHFQAGDTFRSMPLPEIIQRLSGDTQPAVQMPAADRMCGNTIGNVVPYWYLGALAAAKRPALVFEIGTYLGVSALTFALNTGPHCRVLTVDLPEDHEDVSTLTRGDRALVKTAMTNVGAAFQGHPLAARITQLRADSATLNIHEYLKGETVDLFFIDGGHSYDCVSKDTEIAFSSLSPDGLIIWDDYNWIFPELRGFLQMVARSMPLVRIAGTQYVVHHSSL